MITEGDIASLPGACLTGVLVGVGSLVLGFSNDAWITVSCPFFVESEGVCREGHGEDVNSSPLLFPCLNETILRSYLEPGNVLVTEFERGRLVRIVPDDDGLESYVVHIGGDAIPVYGV
jgi:hypothetical protein